MVSAKSGLVYGALDRHVGDKPERLQGFAGHHDINYPRSPEPWHAVRIRAQANGLYRRSNLVGDFGWRRECLAFGAWLSGVYVSSLEALSVGSGGQCLDGWRGLRH